ncbi:hypothetical protein J3492_11975 [Psychrobacter sp. F1192]|uniref:Uncharacterized protein n=1 Tax=Psychrobacter coccoides TaxID=2818440 RepID=A0ABS3NR76_9GAMM|nr:hypothetical protein [Psychrobacter coccoides]MBO1531921.1 hypothetical protein [Psychrobacter coccoides]
MSCVSLGDSYNDSWAYLENFVQVKLNAFVKDLPESHIDDLEYLLNYEPVKISAEERLKKAKMSELVNIIPFNIDSRIIDRMIEIYGHSDNYYSANGWVKEAIVFVFEFSPEHVENIIEVASKNSQIIHSNEYPRLIRAIRSKNIISEDKLNGLLKDNDMEDLVVIASPKVDEQI